MDNIRTYFLNIKDIRKIALKAGLKKTYVNHMRDSGELWNPFLSTIAKLASEQGSSLSALIAKANKETEVYTKGVFEQNIALKDLMEIEEIYSNQNVLLALEYYLLTNQIVQYYLKSEDKRILHHFFYNTRTDIFCRTITDVCKIADISFFSFVRTIESIAYMDYKNQFSAMKSINELRKN